MPTFIPIYHCTCYYLVGDGEYDEYDDASDSDDSSMDQLSATSADGCGVYWDDSDLDIWE